jgi:hypothetical protein
MKNADRDARTTNQLIQILINWFGFVRVISSMFARIIAAFTPPL